jgi:type II secretory pathway pseudopilin PulG
MDPHALAPSVRVLKGLALVVALVIAFLAGVLVERLRFDSRRTDMLRRYEQALRQHQQQLMQSEKQFPAEIAPTRTH